ncbi:MAG: hypothetical protein VW713_07215, partial [Alphaproteobacteria bacterium]
VRTAVQAALADATHAQRGFAAGEDDTMKAQFDPAKNELIELTEAGRAEFVAAVRPVLDQAMTGFREDLCEYLPRS